MLCTEKPCRFKGGHSNGLRCVLQDKLHHFALHILDAVKGTFICVADFLVHRHLLRRFRFLTAEADAALGWKRHAHTEIALCHNTCFEFHENVRYVSIQKMFTVLRSRLA